MRLRYHHPVQNDSQAPGRFRDECLNEHVFHGLPMARRITEAWRLDYNACRPHTSLGGLAPNEFARSQRDYNRSGFWLSVRTSKGQGHAPSSLFAIMKGNGASLRPSSCHR